MQQKLQKRQYLIILTLVYLIKPIFAQSTNNDTLNTAYFDSLSYILNASPGGGYASGNNAYSDLAKAQLFRAGNACNIFAVYLKFGYKAIHSSSDTSYIHINYHIINNTGKSTLSNNTPCPGSIIYTDSIKITDIDTAAGNWLNYSNPVFIDSNFAISIDFKHLLANDTVALFTNKNGDAGTREESWEQAVNSSWNTMKYSWPLAIDFAIFPVVNTAAGIKILGKQPSPLIHVFPNPSTTGNFVINLNKNNIEQCWVLNTSLQSVSYDLVEIGSGQTAIMLKNKAQGVYFLKIAHQGNTTLHKIVVD